jgi:signal transduction histidine kinase
VRARGPLPAALERRVPDGFAANIIAIAVLGAVLGLRAARGGHRALAALCVALALWAASLGAAAHPSARAWGERLLMVGFAVPISLWEAARAEITRAGLPTPAWAGERPRWWARLVAAFFATTGLIWPHLWLEAGGQAPGPGFILMFGAAGALSTAPLIGLLRTLPHTPPAARERLRYLSLAGAACTWGGGINVMAFLLHRPTAAGLSLALLGVGLLAWVVHADRLPAFGRFVEASLRYSIAAAGLTTAYLCAVLVLWPGAGAQLWAQASWGSALQLFLLVLVGQPVLNAARAAVAGRMLPGHGDLEGMARALAESEARSAHHQRLAELGTLSSAVAHELRNPLGVMRASAAVLRARVRGDLAAEAALVEIDAQIDRSVAFCEELLELGRPSPLVRRPVSLGPTAEMAWGSSTAALPLPGTRAFSCVGEEGVVEGDLHQLHRALTILLDNARLATAPGGEVRVVVEAAGHADGPASGETVLLHVDDDGPGVDPALRPRLFQPFVSGRGREGPRPGTGLGLAIAAAIAERHGGSLRLAPGPGPLGGARFTLRLPRRPALPAGL